MKIVLDTNVLVSGLLNPGEVYSTQPLTDDLPDMDDAPFLEVAIAGKACLVTGNTRHYPPHCCKGVQVMTPDVFRDFFINLTEDKRE